MTGLLFDLAFWVTVPFWALMIFAPGWTVTQRVIGSPLIMLPTLVVWVIVAIPDLPGLWAAVSSPELGEFREFVSGADASTLLWAQIIAWDLFIGRWIYFDSRKRGVHPLAMAPLLVLTILLSPIAVLLWFAVRAVRPAGPGMDRPEYGRAVAG